MSSPSLSPQGEKRRRGTIQASTHVFADRNPRAGGDARPYKLPSTPITQNKPPVGLPGGLRCSITQREDSHCHQAQPGQAVFQPQPGQNKRTGGGLSAKTILRYHRFISIVLAQAVRESLVPFNAASMLLYAGMDVVSVASRLGHSQVSTTTDVYAHVLAEADVKSADILSDIYFKNTHAG